MALPGRYWTQQGRTPGVDPNRADFGSYGEFADPDGNAWLIQEVPSRASTEV